MEKIVMEKSKKKIILMILGCALMSLISFMLFNNANEYTSAIYKNTTLIKIAGIIGTIFFGGGSLFLLKKVSGSNVGLLIDSNGITDISNAISVGLIKWEDIKGFRVTNVMSTRFLIVDVVNPDYYLNKAKNNFRVNLMKSNLKLYGTPITLTSNTLKCTFQELEDTLISSFNVWQANHTKSNPKELQNPERNF